MQRLIEKHYNINLIITKKFLFIPYTKKILLKFGEAKFIETMEFMETIKGERTNIIVWLIKFIREHTETKLNREDINWIMMYADNILPKIKDTFFDGCFGGGKTDEENSPMSSYIAILSEKLNIDPLNLVNRYTTKQLEFLTEGLVRNANCMTKEGEKKNRLRIVQQKSKNRPEEEKERIKIILEGLKK